MSHFQRLCAYFALDFDANESTAVMRLSTKNVFLGVPSSYGLLVWTDTLLLTNMATIVVTPMVDKPATADASSQSDGMISSMSSFSGVTGGSIVLEGTLMVILVSRLANHAPSPLGLHRLMLSRLIVAHMHLLLASNRQVDFQCHRFSSGHRLYLSQSLALSQELVRIDSFRVLVILLLLRCNVDWIFGFFSLWIPWLSQGSSMVSPAAHLIPLQNFASSMSDFIGSWFRWRGTALFSWYLLAPASNTVHACMSRSSESSPDYDITYRSLLSPSAIACTGCHVEEPRQDFNSTNQKLGSSSVSDGSYQRFRRCPFLLPFGLGDVPSPSTSPWLFLRLVAVGIMSVYNNIVLDFMASSIIRGCRMVHIGHS